MPKGIYIRTEKIRKGISAGRLRSPKAQKAASGNMKKAREIGRKLHRNIAQIEASRRNGLARKGISNPHGSTVFADDIVKHHNDLCHGVERPDYVTYMASSEHCRLHAKLRLEDGTHPFLTNRSIK